MHTLILITGPQGSGKSRLSSLMRNATEIQCQGKSVEWILHEIIEEAHFKETIVVTTTTSSYFLRRFLIDLAKEKNVNYFHYELYEKERQEKITNTKAKV